MDSKTDQNPGPSLDLLQPSLTREDNLVSFQKPWNPLGLFFVAVFGGILPAGLLASANFHRLGLGRRRLIMALELTLATSLFLALIVALIAKFWAPSITDNSLLLVLYNRALALGMIWSLVRQQSRRFGLYASGNAVGTIFPYAIGAIATAGILQGFLMFKLAEYVMQATP